MQAYTRGKNRWTGQKINGDEKECQGDTKGERKTEYKFNFKNLLKKKKWKKALSICPQF